MFGIALICFVCISNKVVFGKGSNVWKIYSVYPQKASLYYEGIRKFKTEVSTMTGGKIEFEVFPFSDDAFKSWDQFEREMCSLMKRIQTGEENIIAFGTATYWAIGNEGLKCCEAMYSVPHLLNAEDMYGWLIVGGGWEIWKKIYSKYKLMPIPIGNTGGAMGGWFPKEIKGIEDLRGLKIRASGLAGQIYNNLEAKPVSCSASEIQGRYKNKEIEAFICQGPYSDLQFDLDKVGANYYYSPGWQEPGGILSILINLKKWEDMVSSDRKIIETACFTTYQYISRCFLRWNSIKLNEIKKNPNVQIKEFPASVLKRTYEVTESIIGEESNKDKIKIYKSMKRYRETVQNDHWIKILKNSVYRELER